MAQRVHTSISLPPDLYEQLKKLALETDRTLNYLVEKAIGALLTARAEAPERVSQTFRPFHISVPAGEPHRRADCTDPRCALHNI